MNHRLIDPYTRHTFIAVPPALRYEPCKAGQNKENPDSDRHDPRRDAKSIQQLAGDVVRCCHSQSQQGQLSGKDAPSKVINYRALQDHRGKDPENAAAAMRKSQHDQGEDETRCTAKRDVKSAADQKRDPDRRLHAPVSFARNPPRHDRAYRGSNTSGCKEHTDSACGILTNRENAFAKHREQREDAAAQSPGWFDQQHREHAWPILNILYALDRFVYSEQSTKRQLLSFAFLPFGKADTRNQRSRQQVGRRVEDKRDIRTK